MPNLPHASDQIKNLLNESIARELQVSIQYMWQHVLWSGVKGFAVKDAFRKIAIVEMKHAEAIGKRLAYLGGVPTSKPTPIFIGTSLREMIEQNIRDEEGGIELYRRVIETAAEEKDVATRRLFEGILAEEEEHHDTFSSLLEDL